MTAAGRVDIRRSLASPACGVAAYPADDWVGLGGFLSPGTVRLACPVAADHSFAIATGRLEALCGIRLDDQTIRRHCHRAADGLAARRETSPQKAAFAAAEEQVEFMADGVMAPTREGCRELKLAVYRKRPASAPAEPRDWATRDLPGPAATAA